MKRQNLDGIGAEHSRVLGRRRGGALLGLRPALLPRQPRHGAPGERLLGGRAGGWGITK